MGRYVFKLPDVGEGAAEAEITAWRVAVGDVVEEDDPLVDIMTDKAAVEITSPVRGKVLVLNGAPGDLAAVGASLVEFETDEGADEAVAAPTQTPAEKAPEKKPQEATPPAPVETKSASASLAAPAVRDRAKALGVDLGAVRGSGPDGRVTHADLDRQFGGRTGGDAERRTAVHEVKVIGLRRKIAEKMQESKRRIPHFGYVEEVDVTDLEDLRLHLNGTHGDRPKLTLLPFLIRALVRTLPDYPQINALYDDEAGIIRQYAPVHVGIATQTPGGLVVPVVRHAEALDLWDCAAEVARLASAARGGSASREELSGSTITVTSLGPLGGVSHFPVINHPEVAIIGPNRMIERPVARQGQVVVRKMMNLSSAFDHRVVDGYDAASFIQAVKGQLERPALLFVD